MTLDAVVGSSPARLSNRTLGGQAFALSRLPCTNYIHKQGLQALVGDYHRLTSGDSPLCVATCACDGNSWVRWVRITLKPCWALVHPLV